MINLEALRRPLSIDEIDFRVQSINNGGYATILAYKDARADMTRLDEAVGPFGWKREHSNGNANCTVSLYNRETGVWVSKEDTGSESNTEAAKGLASDSFKRACFNWGIGRELYDYPLISVKLFDNEIQDKNGKKYASWNFKLKEWTWFSQFKDGKLIYLAAKDQNGKKRFVWGTHDPSLKEERTNPQASEDNAPDPVQVTTPEEESNGNPEGILKKQAEPIQEVSQEDVRRNELVQKYKIIFGKEPRANMKTETIENKIQDETKKREEAKKSEGSSEAPVYSASGEEADEVEVEEETTDVYSEDKSTIPDSELNKSEDVDFGMYDGPLSDYANKISSFEDKSKFVEWAKNAVSDMSDKVPSDHMEEFREACNIHYSTL